jgi:hypothetical protein
MVINCTGSRTVTRNINAPKQSKLYVVINATTGSQSVVLRGGPTSPTTGVTVANGTTALCAWNGSDYVLIGASGNVTLSANNAFTGANTFYNATGQTFGTATAAQDGIILAGRAGGTSTYRVTLQPTTLSANRTLTLPDANTTIPIASQQLTFSGPTAARTYTLPDASVTLLSTNAAVTVPQGGTGATTLTANNVILGNGTSAVQFVAPSTSGNVLTSNGTTWTSAAVSSSGVTKVTRTSNTALTSSNIGNWISITSGTFTQTFDPCANLGSTWFVYLENAGTGDITLDPSSSETIDGLTSYIMYPGEVRLIQSNGTALTSIVISSFFRTFTSSGTFTKPPGYAAFGVDIIGAGGGGARGQSADYGPAGGGGAGRYKDIFSSAAFSASETVTIGAGGAGATVDATNGSAGGTSSIGAIGAATGGAGGTYNSLGGSGGAAIVAHTGVAGNAGSTGFAGAAPSNAIGAQNAEFGGGSGSYRNASSSDSGTNAGSSLFGGGGGGGGASTGDNVARAGGRGGQSGSYTAGGGGSSTSGAAGGNGAAGNFIICGEGGGGGGTSNTSTGFAGGDGGIPGGGGGGGGNGVSSRGNGGSGARGELRIWGIV